MYVLVFMIEVWLFLFVELGFSGLVEGYVGGYCGVEGFGMVLSLVGV